MLSLKYLLSLIAGFVAGIFCLLLISTADSKVLISKIQTAGTASTTDEFIELYNASADPAPLAGFAHKKLTASGNTSNLVSSFSSVIINPWSYYLIGSRDYAPINGVNSDLPYSNNSTSLADNNSAVLYDASGVEVDRVSWGSTTPPIGLPAQNPEGGQALTRLPNDDTGNSTDTDNNAADFIIIPSNPFNSLSPARALPITEPVNEATTTADNSNSTPSSTDSNTNLNTSSSTPGNNGDTNQNTNNDSNAASSTEQNTASEISPNTTTLWTQIKINEFMPDPASGEEWIELYNASTSSLDLTGGVLCDNRTSASCTIATPTSTISAGEYIVIYLSSSRLNNDGDAVILKNPSGNIVDHIAYSGTLVPGKGESVARKMDGGDTNFNTDWAVTTVPTPGTLNIIAEPVAPPPIIKNTGGSTYSPPLTNQPCSGASCSPTSTTEIALAYTASNTPIIINELLPNPEDSDLNDEFIELKNFSDKTIDLTGWKIADLSTAYKLSGKLGAGRLLVLPRPLTDIALNNTSAEIVTLFAPGAVAVDQAKYNKAGEGLSFSRTASNTWEWSETVTRGKENIFTHSTPIVTLSSESSSMIADIASSTSDSKKTEAKKPDPIKTESKKTSTKKLSPYLGRLNLGEARLADKGDKVTVRGFVVALPGTFGSQIFYLTDETGGMAIFQSKKQFPILAINDYLEVYGTISEANGIKRINIKDKSAIKKLSPNINKLMAVTTTIAEVSDDQLGMLITVTGEITQIKSNQLYIDDGEAEGEIYLKKGAQINKSAYKTGDQIEITGIMEKNKYGLQIWPRNNGDLNLLALSNQALLESAALKQKETNELKKEYGAATAGGLTTVLLAWLARARGMVLVGGLKRVGSLAMRVVKNNKV